MNHPVSHRKLYGRSGELSTHLLSLEFSSQRNFIFHKPSSVFHTVLFLPSSLCLSIVSLLFLAFSPLPNTFSMSWLHLQNLPFVCIKILRRFYFSHWLQEPHTKGHYTSPVWSPSLAFAHLRCYSKQRFSFWGISEVPVMYWTLLQRAEDIFPISLLPSAIVQTSALVELFLLDISKKKIRKVCRSLLTKGNIW